MPVSPLRLVKRFAEFRLKDAYVDVPKGTRGMYALLSKSRKAGKDRYDVVYIGMARGAVGVRSRLRSHKNSVRKGKLWTHFSVFEVWDNVTDDEIAELEGLFRHIYRKDTQANRVNQQRSFKKLRSIRNNNFVRWKP